MSVLSYKFLHIVMVLVYVISMTVLLLSQENTKRAQKIFGVATIFLFVTGFGMLHKLGFSVHTVWVGLKMLIWLLISVAVPIVVKRYSDRKHHLFLGASVLLVLAVYLVIFKP